MSNLTGSLKPVPKVLLTGTLSGGALSVPVPAKTSTPESAPVSESIPEPTAPPVDAAAVGLTRVQDDPAPRLGGDLNLNGFRILEDTERATTDYALLYLVSKL